MARSAAWIVLCAAISLAGCSSDGGTGGTAGSGGTGGTAGSGGAGGMGGAGDAAGSGGAGGGTAGSGGSTGGTGGVGGAGGTAGSGGIGGAGGMGGVGGTAGSGGAGGTAGSGGAGGVGGTAGGGGTGGIGGAGGMGGVGGTPAGGGPDIGVWYGPYQVFGEAGIPQRFVNVLGRVEDPNGIASLSYSLNGAPELPLSIGPNGNRLVRTGDFNVEIAYDVLPPGVSEITIRASDTGGDVSTKVVQVEYVNTVVAPLPYSIDWSSVTEVSDVAQIVDGKWLLTSDGLRVLETGYDRLVAIGDLQWTNYEATVEITVETPLDADAKPLIGLAMRWTGHYAWNNQQPRIGWHPLGALMAYVKGPSSSKVRLFGSDGAVQVWMVDGRIVSGQPTPEPPAGVPYLYKMRGESLPGGEIQYSMKMWPSDQPEPGAWAVTYITDQPPPSGSLLVVVHKADVTVGDVLVVPVGN